MSLVPVGKDLGHYSTWTDRRKRGRKRLPKQRKYHFPVVVKNLVEVDLLVEATNLGKGGGNAKRNQVAGE